MGSAKNLHAAVACVVLLTIATTLRAEQAVEPPSPEAKPPSYVLPPIVVNADKHEKRIDGVAGSIRVLSGDQVERPSTSNLAEVIAVTPGLYIYDLNGSRGNPAADVRGFTAQGEAEYLQVVVDGVPLNGTEAGLAEWLVIDRELVDRVEVVRGPASALYGDAALGGLVNVETRLPAEGDGLAGGASVEGGSFGEARYRGNVEWAGEDLRTAVRGWRQRVTGWREHSAYDGWHGQGTIEKTWSDTSRLRTGVLFADLDREDPGPVPEGATGEARKAASTPFDGRSRRHLLLSGLQTWGRGDERELRLLGYFRFQNGEETRTIIETKEQLTRERSIGAEARWFSELPWRRAGRAWTVAAGLEIERGQLTSRYHDAPGGVRGELTADGKGVRWDESAYFLFEAPIASLWEIQLGGRYDRIDDRFDDRRASTSTSRTMQAFSPKLALNHRFATGGNIYVALTRGFKAPTLEQMFDQRRPLGFPIANPDLDPQYATSIEVGTRRTLGPVPLAVSAYDMRVRDEIGFNLATFTLENIGKSVHRGLEFDIGPVVRGRITLDLAYTYQDARFADGPDDGKQINNVPRHVASGRLAYDRWARWTLACRSVHRLYLDEANEHPIRGFTTFDLEIERPAGWTTWWVAARNLFDREYAGSGYLDAAGDPVVFPAAGVSITAGVKLGS